MKLEAAATKTIPFGAAVTTHENGRPHPTPACSRRAADGEPAVGVGNPLRLHEAMLDTKLERWKRSSEARAGRVRVEARLCDSFPRLRFPPFHFPQDSALLRPRARGPLEQTPGRARAPARALPPGPADPLRADWQGRIDDSSSIEEGGREDWQAHQ